MPDVHLTYTNDTELVGALRAGDRLAVQQVYDTCFPTFESYVRVSGGTQDDARDCFQEGLLSAWVNVRQDRYEVRESAAFTTYVLSVCKYKWMNKMRTAYHKNMSFAAELPDIAEITADDPYEERLRRLNSGISRLGNLCQNLLRMFYFEKLSYEEIEERTGKTADSLKNQKYRCINRLRAMISRTDEIDS